MIHPSPPCLFFKKLQLKYNSLQSVGKSNQLIILFFIKVKEITNIPVVLQVPSLLDCTWFVSSKFPVSLPQPYVCLLHKCHW